jgi:hypothetical protein
MWKERHLTKPASDPKTLYPIQSGGSWVDTSQYPYTDGHGELPVRDEFAYVDPNATRDRWNGFQHFKRVTTYMSGTILSESSRDHDGGGPWLSYPSSVPQDEDGAFSGDPTLGGIFSSLKPLWVDDYTGRYVVTPGNINDLIEDSIRTMLPGIRPKLSILNSIYELKDVKSLGHTLSQIKHAYSALASFKHLASLSKTYKKLGPKMFNYPGGQILKLAGDVFLQKEFNIQPLLRDIADVYSAYHSIGKQVDNLLANRDKVQIRHYKRYLNNLYTGGTETRVTTKAQLGGWSDGDNTKIRTVNYSNALFHAQMEYSYRLIGYTPREARVLGYLDALGVNLNPVIVWNAIPWSFVVDWFVGVNQWLGQFALRNLEPVTYLTRYLWSFKVERIMTISRNGNGTNNLYQPQSPIPTCSVSESAYIRAPMKPDIYRSLRANSLNPKEFILAGALAVTR